MSFQSWFGDLEDARGFWLGFGHLILIWIWSLFFDKPMVQMLALYLYLKSVKTSMSFKSLSRGLEYAGGSWLGYGILILIWICSLLFDTPLKFWLSILILKVQRTSMYYRPWFWALENDLGSWMGFDMVTGLWYTYIPNFCSLSWFWKCKEHPCSLSLDLVLWFGLELCEWGLASWSWFGYGTWSLIHLYSYF